MTASTASALLGRPGVRITRRDASGAGPATWAELGDIDWADATVVLGAGGATGLAFETGLLLALATDHGFAPEAVPSYVGTSAGSLAAALLVSGCTPDELAAMATGSARHAGALAAAPGIALEPDDHPAAVVDPLRPCADSGAALAWSASAGPGSLRRSARARAARWALRSPRRPGAAALARVACSTGATPRLRDRSRRRSSGRVRIRARDLARRRRCRVVRRPGRHATGAARAGPVRRRRGGVADQCGPRARPRASPRRHRPLADVGRLRPQRARTNLGRALAAAARPRAPAHRIRPARVRARAARGVVERGRRRRTRIRPRARDRRVGVPRGRHQPAEAPSPVPDAGSRSTRRSAVISTER